MKTVLLIRHAKSSWDDFNVADFDRPLNERGKKDAPMMAERLREKNVPIDGILSSPAKRASRTAQVFAAAFGIDKEAILYRSELYMAGVEQFYETIAEIDDRYQYVAVFGHNDGITAFANDLRVATIDHIPTCGIFALTAETASWRNFRSARKRFLFYDQPKPVSF